MLLIMCLYTDYSHWLHRCDLWELLEGRGIKKGSVTAHVLFMCLDLPMHMLERLLICSHLSEPPTVGPGEA
jgi:hypothetical protein